MSINLLQAVKIFQDRLASKNILTEVELAKEISDVLDLVDYDVERYGFPRVAPGEPPIVEKYNYFLQCIENILAVEGMTLDILKAITIVNFNYAKRLSLELENKTAGLWDLYQTLQFYINSPVKNGLNEIFLNFQGKEDRSSGVLNEVGKQLTQTKDIGLTLPIIGEAILPLEDADLTGNGFYGRLHTVIDKKFEYELDTYSTGLDITDVNPNTWIEYELFSISDQTLLSTKGFNFGFSDSEEKWALTNVSKLELKVTLYPSAKTPINMICLDPIRAFGQYTIKSVVLDTGGGVLQTLEPKNLVVTPEISEHRFPDKASKAVYVFPGTVVEKIYINIVQDNSYPCTIGHIYYTDPSGTARISGPSPPLLNPVALDFEAETKAWIRKIEYLPANRFVISVADIELTHNSYTSNGFFISKPIEFSTDIDRVAIEVDEIIPAECTIKYSISFDETDWFYFKPIGSSTTQQVIAINDRRPEAYQDSSTVYAMTDGKPNNVFLKIEMNSTGKDTSVTPLVKQCKLKVSNK